MPLSSVAFRCGGADSKRRLVPSVTTSRRFAAIERFGIRFSLAKSRQSHLNIHAAVMARCALPVGRSPRIGRPAIAVLSRRHPAVQFPACLFFHVALHVAQEPVR